MIEKVITEEQKVEKEIELCDICCVDFLVWKLCHAKWKGEECANCKVKRMDLIRRRNKIKCLDKNCPQHKTGIYAR